MEKEQLQAVLNQVSEEVQQKINSISEEVKINDIQEILETLGIINKQQNIEAGGITETEKNRFNSKFEILKGEELDNENVLKVVEAVKDNIINAQVDTNEEIKIEISRNESNQDIEKSLEEYIKKEKDKKYDIKIEYDENTESKIVSSDDIPDGWMGLDIGPETQKLFCLLYTSPSPRDTR